MKRLILVLALTGASWAQGGIISGTVFNPNGKPVPGALIAVGTLASSGIPLSPGANIYTDQTLVTQMVTNTVTADSLGNYTIYVPSGYYHIQISGTGLTTSTYTVQAASAVATFAVQSSTDLGLSVQTCILRLPSTGGLCDASSITGSQTLSTVVQVNKPNVGIKWGQIQLSLCQPSASAFSWQANNLHMWGAGQGVTVFTNCVAGKNVLSSNFTLNSSLQGLEVNGISLVGGSGTSGVTALNGQDDAITVGSSTHAVSQVNIHDVEFSGFALNALHAINGTNIKGDDNYVHNIAEGIRFCGVTHGEIMRNTFDTSNLVSTVFTVVQGLDARASCGNLDNFDVKEQGNTVLHYVNGEAAMLHNCTDCNVSANIFKDVLFGIGADLSSASDALLNNTFASNTIEGTSTAGGDGSAANYGIFVGGFGTAETVGTTIVGNTISGMNQIDKADQQGGIAVNNADLTTIVGNTVKNTIGTGIAINSGSVGGATRLLIEDNNISNITASSLSPDGPTGGIANCIGLDVSNVGSTTGRIQNNQCNSAVNGISLGMSAPGLLIGPNDYFNVSGSNILNPTNAALASTFPGLALFTGSTSGTTTVKASAAASGTLTLPAASDTLIGKATTDTLSGKSFNQNVIPLNAGAVDVGQVDKPFLHAWFGTAATNNVEYIWNATAAARTVTQQDPGGNAQARVEISGTVTIDLASVATAACSADSSDVTVTGAVVGDDISVTAATALQAGGFLIGRVTAASTARFQFCNLSGGAIDRASDTYTLRVKR